MVNVRYQSREHYWISIVAWKLHLCGYSATVWKREGKIKKSNTERPFKKNHRTDTDNEFCKRINNGIIAKIRFRISEAPNVCPQNGASEENCPPSIFIVIVIINRN